MAKLGPSWQSLLIPRWKTGFLRIILSAPSNKVSGAGAGSFLASEQLGVKGIMVLNAVEGGPAWKAGIQVGNGQKLTSNLILAATVRKDGMQVSAGKAECELASEHGDILLYPPVHLIVGHLP
eukprot:564498-Pelagomonas_calceolata.AAC.2